MLTHSPAVSTYAQYYKILLKTIDTLLCDSLMTMLSWITTTEDDNFISLLPCSPALSFVLWEWGTWWWDGADDFDMKFELRLIFFQVERCLSASPLSRLQSVCTHGSEFTYRWAHSRIKFVFVDHDFCVESGVRCFQAPFGAYAMVISETPGLYVILYYRKMYFIIQTSWLQMLIYNSGLRRGKGHFYVEL